MNSIKERREAKRHKLSVDLKFLLRGEIEAVGVLLDISAGGLALFTDVEASIGDEIVVYPVGLGRLPGRVARKFKSGLGVELTLSGAQRQSIEERIAAALSGAPYFKLTERRSDLCVKYNLDTVAQVRGDDEPFRCTIVDMSRGGCRLRAEEQPPIGSKISVGALNGIVMRHMEKGFFVEFQKFSERSTERAAEYAA